MVTVSFARNTIYLFFLLLLVTHLLCDYHFCCCCFHERKQHVKLTGKNENKKKTFRLIFAHFSSFAWCIHHVQSIVVIRNSREKKIYSASEAIEVD